MTQSIGCLHIPDFILLPDAWSSFCWSISTKQSKAKIQEAFSIKNIICELIYIHSQYSVPLNYMCTLKQLHWVMFITLKIKILGSEDRSFALQLQFQLWIWGKQFSFFNYNIGITTLNSKNYDRLHEVEHSFYIELLSLSAE